ncbi:MAG: DUF5718 family protein [Methylococcaceae bacterium]|nr:DUF5718 family protein [Methylococcaceae bacterium]
MKISIDQLKKLPVFGIAGNFAEHLRQAGEDGDFVNVITEEKNAPKGIFPIYLPQHSTFLGTFPLSHTHIDADFSAPVNLHMEPEMCVLFNVDYTDEQVKSLEPLAFSVFNDCSIRKPNANKISEKKNWGLACTGIGREWIEIDQFQTGGVLDHIHIASYLCRNGEVIQYGVDSPVIGYQYFYSKLLNWMIKTFNSQNNFGPLEYLQHYLLQLKQPKQFIISLGATRYTEFGETGFLKPEDKIGIFVYDARKADEADIEDFFTTEEPADNFLAGVALMQSIRQIK